MSDVGVNRFRSLVASGQRVLGCWCTLPSSLVAESVSAAGYDAVIVDLQHGALSWDTAAPVVQAVELGEAVPILRVAWNEPQALMKALDLGAMGVIVPMVNDAAEARRAASAMRYPPDGDRSYGPARRKYATVGEANADVMCLPMIETADGLRNVEEIAATEGVDGLFVGPADLGLSLGVGFDPTLAHPRVLEAFDVIVAAAHRHGRIVGTVAGSQAHAEDLFRRGVHFVTLGSDKTFVAGGATASLAALRSARDGAAEPAPEAEFSKLYD